MTEPRALVFDMDGVLIQSEPVHQRDWLLVFRQFGVDFPPEQLGALQGLRGEQVIDWLGENLGDAVRGIDMEALILEKRRRFIEDSIAGLEALPGVDAFLRRHKGRVPLALVTSARLQVVGQVMKRFGWRNIFDALVGAEHVTQPKPHPEAFLKAAERFHLQASECLVFEDSRVGIQAARAAGCRVCAVTSSLGGEELRAAGAEWTIRDFEDAPALERALAGQNADNRTSWMRRIFGSR